MRPLNQPRLRSQVLNALNPMQKPKTLSPNGKSHSTASTARTDAVADIRSMLSRIGDGLDLQNRTLEEATSETNKMAASLKETAGQAQSVATATDQIVSSINEVAASVEQVTANVAQVASAATQTTASIKSTAASIQGVTADAQEMATSAQEVTSAITEVTASMKRVNKDSEGLAASLT